MDHLYVLAAASVFAEVFAVNQHQRALGTELAQLDKRTRQRPRHHWLDAARKPAAYSML